VRELRLSSTFGALFSQAAAERVGIHSTDLETMDLLLTLGPMTAGELSRRTGLTSGATTRLIDRLEHEGFVRRLHDEADRRRVIIVPVEDNLAELGAVFEPLAEAMHRLWLTFDPQQQRTILEFTRRANAIAAAQNAALRALPPAGGRPTGAQPSST
jgi:DNA-binding MarR family transcriptional regulator